MKYQNFLLVLLACLLVVVPILAAPVNFTEFVTYGDAYKANNDTYTDVKWNATGTRSPWVATGNATSVEYLVIGGAGSGASSYAGGGGAGGYRTYAVFIVSGSLSVIVGAGGNSVNGGTPTVGNDGVASVFGSITSPGGGGGGSNVVAGRNGGAGGGGGWATGGSTGGIGSYGYNGGVGSIGTPDPNGGGGGGGAGAVGAAGTGTGAGNGGIGNVSLITGIATYYSGGGGGSTISGTQGAGGTGGGGAGGVGNIGIAGTDGLGGGGGGADTNKASG